MQSLDAALGIAHCLVGSSSALVYKKWRIPVRPRGTRRASNDAGMGVRGKDIEACALPLCRPVGSVRKRGADCSFRFGLRQSLFAMLLAASLTQTHLFSTHEPLLLLHIPRLPPCKTPISHCCWPSPGSCREVGEAGAIVAVLVPHQPSTTAIQELARLQPD